MPKSKDDLKRLRELILYGDDQALEESAERFSSLVEVIASAIAEHMRPAPEEASEFLATEAVNALRIVLALFLAARGLDDTPAELRKVVAEIADALHRNVEDQRKSLRDHPDHPLLRLFATEKHGRIN
jgi:hypothetical protein